MFSSINPFEYLPSTSHHLPPSLTPPPPPLFDEMFLYQPSAPQLPISPPLISENSLNLYNSTMTTTQGIDHHGTDHAEHHNNKRPMKKDRHSKINTAQGLRDRRVRLSIKIAREFFDLQEMLGFDKASKTLNWLLMQSKNAISELAAGTNKSFNHSPKIVSSTSHEQCEVISKKKSLVGVCSKKKTIKSLHKVAFGVIAKESRARARARARDRTLEKMCTRRLQNNKNLNILNELKSLSEIHAYARSSPINGDNLPSSLMVLAHEFEEARSCPSANYCQAERQEVIEESIMIKRKLKPPSIVGFNQHNLVMPKDLSFNGDNNSSNIFLNLTQNRNFKSMNSIELSTFCAIAKANLSTGPFKSMASPIINVYPSMVHEH